jgi:hypothetical protein
MGVATAEAVKRSDGWLSKGVPPLRNSRAYTPETRRVWRQLWLRAREHGIDPAPFAMRQLIRMVNDYELCDDARERANITASATIALRNLGLS